MSQNEQQQSHNWNMKNLNHPIFEFNEQADPRKRMIIIYTLCAICLPLFFLSHAAGKHISGRGDFLTSLFALLRLAQ